MLTHTFQYILQEANQFFQRPCELLQFSLILPFDDRLKVEGIYTVCLHIYPLNGLNIILMVKW